MITKCKTAHVRTIRALLYAPYTKMDGSQIHRQQQTFRVDLEVDLESMKKKMEMVNLLIEERTVEKEVEVERVEKRVVAEKEK